MSYLSKVTPEFLKKHWRFYRDLTPDARDEFRRDRNGLPEYEQSIETSVKQGVDWLCRAQDHSLSTDGGVAGSFSLLTGWSNSYPETTGYIIPIIIEYAKITKNTSMLSRARRMLDWLVSIQFAEGGFQGGMIGCKKVFPVTFNTGQILIGLAAGVREFGKEYRGPMCRAANWLVKAQDHDGCWRKLPSGYNITGEKTYEAHTAWGLLETAKIEENQKYADSALANIEWCLKHQSANGWFDKCSFSDSDHNRPLTHTLGYVFRGILEAYQFTEDPEIIKGCKRIADGLLKAIRKDGFIPGRLSPNWEGMVESACLTGTVQIAYCWLKMFQITGKRDYRDAAYAANRYVRRTMKTSGSLDTRGAIKGSFPINGEYNPYEYPNWGCRFFVESNMLELAVT